MSRFLKEKSGQFEVQFGILWAKSQLDLINFLDSNLKSINVLLFMKNFYKLLEIYD